jgi:hypothetical protein
MKSSLLKIFKASKKVISNSWEAINGKSNFNKEDSKAHPSLSQRKLLFTKIKKSHITSINDKHVDVYTVPVQGCEYPSKCEKEIRKAVQKYLSSKKAVGWCYYGIEKEEVKICKLPI